MKKVPPSFRRQMYESVEDATPQASIDYSPVSGWKCTVQVTGNGPKSKWATDPKYFDTACGFGLKDGIAHALMRHVKTNVKGLHSTPKEGFQMTEGCFSPEIICPTLKITIRYM
jgi:hypothetical protein